MPGQRLMCVWETASVMAPTTGEGHLDAAVLKALLAASMRNSPFVKFLPSLYQEMFSDKGVTFEKCKTYIRHCVHDKLIPFSRIEDDIESLCWAQCKSHYKLEELKFKEECARQLWQIYVLLTETDSFPPYVGAEDVSWFTSHMTACISEMNANHSSARQTWHLLTDKTKFTYKEFLAYIRDRIVGLEAAVVKHTVEEMHRWLVKEVSMAGWLYKRTKKQANWTGWLQRWFILSPGKLTYYDSPKCEEKKGEIAVTSRSVVESLPPCRGTVLVRKMAFRFRLTNKPYIELEMNAFSEAERASWLASIHDMVESSKLGNTQVQMLLGKRARAYTMSMVDVSDKKLQELKLRSMSSRDQSVQRTSQGWYQDDTRPEVFTPKSPLQLTPSTLHWHTEEEGSLKIVRAKVRALFNKCDTNGNGCIDREEFTKFMCDFGQLNLDQDELREIFDTIDKDGSNVLTFDEFYDYFILVVLKESYETTYVENRLRTQFLEADKDCGSMLKLHEFIEYAHERKRSIDRDMLAQAFREMTTDENDEVPFEELCHLLSTLNQDDQDVNISLPRDKKTTLERCLKSVYRKTEVQNMATFIRERWTRFASFKRYGVSGNLVMTGASGMVADVLPGQYNLVDLACFSDKIAIQPKRVVIRGVKWEKNVDPGRAGLLVFPSSYDGSIPVDIATTEHARYYGCSLADNTQVKVSLLYRHGIQDFTYQNDYLHDFVEGKSGPCLEHHDFCHLDCPLEDDSGYFILGKMVQGVKGEELHLTAFIVPTRHTLYVPGGTIHSNDYLKGTWRTMLSDEADVNLFKIVKCIKYTTTPVPFTFKMTGRYSKLATS